jgi:hypothetical protein
MGTLTRVILDRLGNEKVIIHPTNDSELNDPAHAAQGTDQQYDFDNTSYSSAVTVRAKLVLFQQKVSDAGRAILASLLQKRIDLIDAFIAAQSDYDLWQTRLNQWPSPTQPQTTLINAARAQYLQDLQNIQTIRDSITTLTGQVP